MVGTPILSGGAYVWPTLYYSLKDANVKRWLPLYATESTTEDDKKTYSLLGFTWAFKTWILEVFRLGPNEFYTRHMRYPRIVAWTSNKKFYRPMLRDFLHGRVPAERLIPDEVEAGSGNKEWHGSNEETGPNNVEAMKKHMERAECWHTTNKGGPSPFQTPTNNSIFNTATPTNWQTSMPSQPGSSNWHSQMPVYTPTPNWHPLTRRILNILERPKRVQRPSVYIQSPFTSLPATTELPKKRVGRTKKNSKNDNLSPLNLGNAFAHDNVGGDDVLITGTHDTGIYFTYENVDPNKQMNSWIEIIIRSRPQDADWTVSKSGTACVHLENNRFLIETDPHIIGMLDGS
ncbi:hypothetical protein Tco_1163343 [Tanacetum coccineum]